MIDVDLCLSPILGLSMRLFLEAGLAVDRLFCSDSDIEAAEDALDREGDSCELSLCNGSDPKSAGDG